MINIFTQHVDHKKVLWLLYYAGARAVGQRHYCGPVNDTTVNNNLSVNTATRRYKYTSLNESKAVWLRMFSIYERSCSQDTKSEGYSCRFLHVSLVPTVTVLADSTRPQRVSLTIPTASKTVL